MKLAPSKALLIGLVLSASLITPAVAHQPVLLSAKSNTIEASPILVDGQVSFAVTANLTGTSQTRHFRFALRDGERLKLEYLILDRQPENRIKQSRLPLVTVETPSGEKISLAISERTKFFEPYSKRDYLYLSRIDQRGESGIYTVTVKARAKASIVLAIGNREVSGEVMSVGSRTKTCPPPVKNEVEVKQSRANQLISLSERAGELCAIVNGWGYRVVQRDGEDFPVTMDYRPDRINVKVRDGKIFEITIG